MAQAPEPPPARTPPPSTANADDATAAASAATQALEHEQGRRLARACRIACAVAPVPVVAGLACAFWPGEHAEILGAIAIALAFLGTFLGLAGIFGFVLARERSRAVVRPRWCLSCAIFGIVGGFVTSLLGSY